MIDSIENIHWMTKQESNREHTKDDEERGKGVGKKERERGRER